MFPPRRFWRHFSGREAICIIDQACSVKMAGYSPSSFFCVFMNRDEAEFNKNAKKKKKKKKRSQHPVILTEQAWGSPRGGPCSLVPFQNCPMFPCSHTFSECFLTVIFRNVVPCFQKLANVPLFPSIFCQFSLVPQNPWETLKLGHKGFIIWPRGYASLPRRHSFGSSRNLSSPRLRDERKESLRERLRLCQLKNSSLLRKQSGQSRAGKIGPSCQLR